MCEDVDVDVDGDGHDVLCRFAREMNEYVAAGGDSHVHEHSSSA